MGKPISFSERIGFSEEQIANLNRRFFPFLPQDIPSTAADNIRQARVQVLLLYGSEMNFPSPDGSLHGARIEGEGERINMRSAEGMLAKAWEFALPADEAKACAKRDVQVCLERLVKDSITEREI